MPGLYHACRFLGISKELTCNESSRAEYDIGYHCDPAYGRSHHQDDMRKRRGQYGRIKWSEAGRRMEIF